MSFLYNISVYIYLFRIKFSSLFNRKAKLWVKGRRELFSKMSLELFDREDNEELIWVHCFSLSEFEQGRPVIEKLKKLYPEKKVLLTFFSPTAYEISKNYNSADYIFYLPIDTKKSAKKFIKLWNPSVVVFVKCQFWYNYLNELYQQKIPVVFISSIFNRNNVFFKFYGAWFRNQLRKITYFFVQNKESLLLLDKLGIRNAVASGDTRFDRVIEIKDMPVSFPDVELFIQGSIIFIAGSSRIKDHEVLVPLINKNYNGIKYIIVPNEINHQSIDTLSKNIKGITVKLSDPDKSQYPKAQVLIIDRIGLLSQLYQYASIAYIGGGFGKGLHNTIEAAVFGMPILFGPNYGNSQEAKELVKYGGAFCVKNKECLINETYRILSDYNVLKISAEISKEYVRLKKGATERIIIFIQALLNNSKSLVKKLEKDINLN